MTGQKRKLLLNYIEQATDGTPYAAQLEKIKNFYGSRFWSARPASVQTSRGVIKYIVAEIWQ